MQQLLQNSQFGGHSMGRPPALPLDRAARSPFDVALGRSPSDSPGLSCRPFLLLP